MIKSIDEYLLKLKKELSGYDPATVQAALSDSEEHLREAIRSIRSQYPNRLEVDVLQEAIKKYGMPKEIAATYTDMTAGGAVTLWVPLSLVVLLSTLFSAIYFLCQGILLLFYNQFHWGGFGSLVFGKGFFIWALLCLILSLALVVFTIYVWISYRKKGKDLPLLISLVPVFLFLAQGIAFLGYWATRTLDLEREDSGIALLIGILSLSLSFIMLLTWFKASDNLWLARIRQFSREKKKQLIISGVTLILIGIGAYLLSTPWSTRGSKLEGPIDEQWVARYSGFSDGYGQTNAMTVDDSGNVYITGMSNSGDGYGDYLTIKYDSSGNQIWDAYYNGAESRYDEAKAIAVDDSGNVYVTGGSTAEGDFGHGLTDYNYTTIKYDSRGNQLWVVRYNGPGKGYDEASAIALNTSGNIYITGTITGDGTESDYATIKYDSDGNQLWVAWYNGPTSGSDHAYDMVMDQAGNIYVTGESYSEAGDHRGNVDYATIMYDSDGNQLWVARYNHSASPYNLANAIAVDDLGNVYVTGSSTVKRDLVIDDIVIVENGIFDLDSTTIKYSSMGQQIWIASYSGPENSNDVTSAIAVDDSGNVYVAGYREATVFKWADKYNGRDRDYLAIKYDSDGNQLWIDRYDGPASGTDEAIDLAVDHSGKVYIAGTSQYKGYDYDATTICYDADGNRLWVASYNSPASGIDEAQALNMDNLGNVYISVASRSVSGIDCLTIKYTPDNIE